VAVGEAARIVAVIESRWRMPSSTTKSLPWPCILVNRIDIFYRAARFARRDAILGTPS
jgi:hypothetical protein